VDVNQRLKAEVMQRQLVEQKLKQLNAELEHKTSGLEVVNKELINRERDVIEREERIRQLNMNLEKKVAERTEELHVSNQELEAFTYSVSHDLRAPLRAIDGYARILEEDYNQRLDAHGKRLIDVITRNARYMGQLIDDLLEFSRTSRTELIASRFDSDLEVRKIASEMMVHEKNRDIEIDIRSMDCKGDVKMLRQVWINLISNAIKYTRKKEHARIEIGSSKLSSEVQFYIKDNGIGFDMAYANKLFGVFQRLHKKEVFEGTGVGLALVKRILDRHKCRVWAEAEINEGATFYFSLPL
jgi:light-regulated signal transduction histidine kinase (bacteriophytochrome)